MVLSPINSKKLSGKKNILIKILTTTDTSYSHEYSFVGDKIKTAKGSSHTYKLV